MQLKSAGRERFLDDLFEHYEALAIDSTHEPTPQLTHKLGCCHEFVLRACMGPRFKAAFACRKCRWRDVYSLTGGAFQFIGAG
jgi:hypothetical protein